MYQKIDAIIGASDDAKIVWVYITLELLFFSTGHELKSILPSVKHIHAHIHIYIYIYTHTYTHANIRIQIHTYIRMCIYNLCQKSWNTGTIPVAHLVVSLPSPQNNVVVSMVKRHKKYRHAWRLVSGRYTLNSTFFQGEGFSIVRHRQKHYNNQIWIN